MSNIIVNDNKENILRAAVADSSMSRNARGILLDLLYMESNASVKTLADMSSDGQYKVSSALKELETKGYLSCERTRARGKWIQYNYVLTNPHTDNHIVEVHEDLFLESLNQPVCETESYNMEMIEISKPNLGEPYLDNQDTVVSNVDNTVMDNLNSIYNQDIDMIDNNISNQSSNPDSTAVKNQINYQSLINETSEEDKDLIDMMVDIISEIYHSKNPWTRVSGRSMPTRKVVTQLMKLNKSDMLYVIDCINSTNTTIRSIKPYLITSLYNAAMTQDSRKMSDRFNKRKNKKKQAEKDCNANSTISMDLYYQTVDLIDKELYALGDACYA